MVHVAAQERTEKAGMNEHVREHVWQIEACTVSTGSRTEGDNRKENRAGSNEITWRNERSIQNNREVALTQQLPFKHNLEDISKINNVSSTTTQTINANRNRHNAASIAAAYAVVQQRTAEMGTDRR